MTNNGMTNKKNKQLQKRNAGVSPLQRQSAPLPVEMTVFCRRCGRTGNGNGNDKSNSKDKATADSSALLRNDKPRE
jgi:hypothetical protein